MVSWGHEKTVVRRLRVRGRKLDPLAAQLRLDNLLQTTELHPAWLPPSAIVCLHQLRDPLPRVLKLQSRSAMQSLAWQQAVSAVVQEKIRSAVRPVSAEVSSEASAVIFNDQAELLACLAMDWLEDRLGSRWWWRSLFKDQDVAGIVPEAWSNAPQYVPQALELLATKHRLEPFARALSADRARVLLREVTRSFALHELQSALDAGFEQVSRGPGDDKTPAPQFQHASLDSNATGVRSRPVPPWRLLVPESLAQSPGLERECLIGVALTIRRAPAAARSSRFARATLSWLRAAGADEIVPVGDSSEPYAGRGAQSDDDLQVKAHRESLEVRQSTATLSGPAARESLLSEPTPPGRHAKPRPATKESPRDEPEYPPQSTQAHIFSSSSDLDTTGASERKAAPSARRQSLASSAIVRHIREASTPGPSNSIASPGDETSPASFPEEQSFEAATDVLRVDEVRVETEFGGIFYLINLGIFLELYGDFTAPARKSLALSIFDFIALVGRRLLNGQITEDPVWELLAQLAGRGELDAPGKGFEPPDEWRLPAQWLEAFPDERRFEWTTDGERLRVGHPAGFLLLDVPLADSPAKQLKREMMVYHASAKRQRSRKSFSVSRNGTNLEQWLDWIMPYVRVRLCRALGIADASDPGLALGAQRASILLTGVHLDIFFALSEHPLEIRLAGLDRDPGWVPAAGRFVRFHYQS